MEFAGGRLHAGELYLATPTDLPNASPIT